MKTIGKNQKKKRPKYGRAVLCIFVLLVAGRLIYIQCFAAKIVGIDISHHNGVIQWEKVPQDVEFVYIKATEGKAFRDKRCEVNYRKAKERGLKVGFYHFFKEDVPAWDQYQNFISKVGKYDMDLIPVIDVEACKDRGKVKSELHSLCILLDDFYGIKPIIYTDLGTYYTFWNCFPNGHKMWGRVIPCNCFLRLLAIEQENVTRMSGFPSEVDINYCRDLSEVLYFCE